MNNSFILIEDWFWDRDRELSKSLQYRIVSRIAWIFYHPDSRVILESEDKNSLERVLDFLNS